MGAVNVARHAERRGKILDAAGRCFGRDGFRGASTSAICKEAGISPGHLFHYFATKEEIVEAMVERHLEGARSRLDRVMAGVNVLEGFLTEIWQVKAKSDWGKQALLLDLFAEASRNTAVAKILREHTLAIRGLLTAFLRSGQARGEVDASIDPEVAAVTLISAMDGMQTLQLRNPDLDPTDSITMLATMIRSFFSPKSLGRPR